VQPVLPALKHIRSGPSKSSLVDHLILRGRQPQPKAAQRLDPML
jgi:hypothetical protein